MVASCLLAFAAQRGCASFEVVVLLNNCDDDTLQVVQDLEPSLPYRLHVRQVRLAPELLSAGLARRLAMQEAAALVDPAGVLMTSDADSQVPPNWVAANLACLAAGADAVAGKTILNRDDEACLPAQLISDENRLVYFSNLLDEIDWLIDPAPYDPWPRHTEHSGASIALRANFLSQVGGIPNVPVGEDRQLFMELRRIDARIRHAREVTVTVSGRTVGRAKGGMADTLANRLVHPDEWLDETFETASSRLTRALARASLRSAWIDKNAEAVGVVAVSLGLSPSDIQDLSMELPYFGMFWSGIEPMSPLLRKVQIPTSRLEEEISAALDIVGPLRAAKVAENEAENSRFLNPTSLRDMVMSN